MNIKGSMDWMIHSCFFFFQLEAEVSRSNDVSNAFSNQVIKEYQVFQRAKTDELKQGLKAYADSHITFYEKVRMRERWGCE